MKRLILIIPVLMCTVCFAQKEQLGLNLVIGETYLQNQTSYSIITQYIQGQRIEIGMTLGGKISYKVLEFKDEVYHLDVTYQSLFMTMEMAKEVMTFSSDKEDTEDIMSTLLKNIMNKPFLVMLEKNGKVKEIQNIENIFEGIFDDFKDLSGTQKDQLKEQLMKSYGNESVKGNFEMVTAIFPDKPVEIGDKWTIQTDLAANMASKLKTVYELKEINADNYVIEGKGTVKTDKSKITKSNNMDIKYNLKGTLTSTIKVDRSTGWIIEATLNEDLDGTANVQKSGKYPDGLKIPMTVSNKMTTTAN